jgi:DNA processing protein
LPRINSLIGGIKRLNGVRTAIATKKALKNAKSEYPYFVHKWTKQRRHYTIDDLNLPNAVFFRGTWPSWDRPVIGIGGTRTPTVDTFCLVANVTQELSKAGALIISGGVPGVDLACHLAAIDNPAGATMAVLANPVNLGFRGHEWHNDVLQTEVLKRGVFVSEYQERRDVFGPEYCERLLARDRIITGLSDLFIAFECNEDSATVDTAHRALVQGKTVFCVESIGKSVRHGIEELCSDYSVPILSERRHSAKEIAQEILKTLHAAQPTSSRRIG